MDTKRGSIVIIGCGDLGTEAGLRFAGAGYRVQGWRRRPELLPAQLAGVQADLAGPLPELPADAEAVVFAPAAPERSVEAYEATYLRGLERVLDAIDSGPAAPARMLLVSSTAVYGDADGAWVDEDTPAVPATPTGKVLLETEELLLRRRPDGLVLRLAGIYGPGRTRLIDQVRSGTASAPAGPHPTNRIHRDDAAAAIVHLIRSDASPGTYIGVDDAPAEMSDVVNFLARETGASAPAQTDGKAARGGNRLLSNTRLRGTGFEFAYPDYRSGYRAVLAGQGTRHP
ncbi:NAD-dependent epimerase/dehydratase family protein [Arthrobacter sp. USHLN218]|uniref:NAD-dependent epimerase/dehydratase family protein n=1 Tax=Arthrobacter sp. USHLN218 TaxID=3081232 RepID=UPI0030188D77